VISKPQFFIAIKGYSGKNIGIYFVGAITMDKQGTPPPQKRPVVFKSKKQIKEEWAKLDLPDLGEPKTLSEEHSALDEIYNDDVQGLGNE